MIRGILGVMVCLTVLCFCGFVSQAAEGTVTAETAKIRAQADGNSEVVGSTVKGKVIDIVGAEADSSGTKWYKVPIAGNSYGFIRSDLVKTSEDIAVSATNNTALTPSDGGSAPAATVPTAIGEQQATIVPASAKVRSGASTQHASVGSLPQGTTVTLIGEANDSAGKKWYQISCNYNGNNIEGYVRSDLVTVGAAAPPADQAEQPAEGGENPEGGEAPPAEGENPEGENPEGGEAPVEEPAPEPEHRDYEVVYNEDVYWLYDNTNGTMMKVQDLLGVVNKANESNADLEKQVQNEKIIIIVLAVIIVILVIVITVLLLKIRNLYYEDYEDDEEEEEEDEIEDEPVVRKKKRAAPVMEPEEEQPVRRKRPVAEEPQERVRPSRERVQARPVKERTVRQASPEEAEIQAAERRQTAKKPAPRKTQNFLLEDDEFEFEFLNMDDKDL